MSRDDKFKPDIALEMTKDLVMRENVDILMGSTNSGGALAMSEIATEGKDPLHRNRCEERQDNRARGAPLRVQHE